VKRGGVSAFQVMTDYDYTLTMEKFNDGSTGDSSFKTIIDYDLMPKETRKLAGDLYKKYMPIERDATLSNEVKLEHLEQWWTQDLDAFTSVGFTRANFSHMVLKSKLLFRKGLIDLMHLSGKHEMPFLIVSGGIAEVIEASLCTMQETNEVERGSYAEKCMNNYMRIISNEFLFKEDDSATSAPTIGYKIPMIHSGNKASFIYELEEIETMMRPNVLVMGDIVEDSRMAQSEKHDTVLKVGFMNNLDKSEAQIAEYHKAFDLIVGDDGSLCPVNHLLWQLFDSESPHLDIVREMEGFRSLEKALEF